MGSASVQGKETEATINVKAMTDPSQQLTVNSHDAMLALGKQANGGLPQFILPCGIIIFSKE